MAHSPSIVSPVTFKTVPKPELVHDESDLSRQPRWKEALICLSLANLGQLRTLADLPPFLPRASTWLQDAPPAWYHYGSYLAVLALASGMLWSTWWLAWRWPTRPWRIVRLLVWLAMIGAALNSLRHILWTGLTAARWSIPGGADARTFGYVIAAAVALAALLAWRRSVGFRVLLWRFLALMVPLVPAHLLAIGWHLARPLAEGWQRGGAAVGAAATLPARQRVVYLMLDEWDYHLTYLAHPADVQTAGFERLKQHSYFATAALPPGPATLQSVPSLLSGRVCRSVSINGPAEVLCQGEAGSARLGDGTDLIGRLHTAGYGVGIAGWYLPYCRIFDGQYTACRGWSAAFHGYPPTRTLADTMWINIRSWAESDSRGLFGQPRRVEWTRTVESQLLAYTQRLAADEKLAFVYAHLPVLHGPFYYSRRTRAYTLRGSPERGYLDAIDRGSAWLDEFRRQLSRTPAGKNTILIVTSDHSYRRSAALGGQRDYRVPFAVVFPGDAAAVEDPLTVHTEQMSAAIDALLDGEIRSPAELARWAARRRAAESTTGGAR
jgi:hypothetical protein